MKYKTLKDLVAAKYGGETVVSATEMSPELIEKILEIYMYVGRPFPVDVKDFDFLGMRIIL